MVVKGIGVAPANCIKIQKTFEWKIISDPVYVRQP